MAVVGMTCHKVQTRSDEAESKNELDVGRICAVMGLLADPTRFRIVCELTERDRNVTELIGILGMRQQAVSHHLGILVLEGVVARRRIGRNNYYSVGRELTGLVGRIIGWARG